MYGKQPKQLGVFDILCEEMMFYQYLPIKLKEYFPMVYEQRLKFVERLVEVARADFISEFGLGAYVHSYVYLTVKHLYQAEGCSFNRKGYHSDGFMTDDINYIWSDSEPTVFSNIPFNLTMDDKISMREMEEQSHPFHEVTYDNKSLLRLDQYSIHKVADRSESGVRTFVKISFSEDKYDLKGNAKNHLLDYDWQMRERDIERNIPQNLINHETK